MDMKLGLDLHAVSLGFVLTDLFICHRLFLLVMGMEPNQTNNCNNVMCFCMERFWLPAGLGRARAGRNQYLQRERGMPNPTAGAGFPGQKS